MIGLFVALVLAQSAGEPDKRLDLFHPPVPEKDAPSYRLDPEKDGLVYRGPKFTAHIAPDGAVHFEDKVPVKRLLPLPTPLPAGTPTLGGMVRDFLARRPRKPAPPSSDSAPPPQTINATPSIWPSASEVTRMDCENPNNANCRFPKSTKVVPGGGFVDWERFLLGIPDKAAAREDKAHFLAATEPLRTRMAEEAHAENLKAALLDLPSLLEKIWSSTQYPPAERRRLLHELWREYAEMPGTAPSCATILGFIRRRLPAGSPNAYTAAELAHLRPDAGPRFDPYGP